MMQLSLLGIMKNVPNVHTTYLQNFFFYEPEYYNIISAMKFSEVDIKKKDISKVILLITFLIYPRHLQGSHICLHN